jgi:hypothetical protein
MGAGPWAATTSAQTGFYGSRSMVVVDRCITTRTQLFTRGCWPVAAPASHGRWATTVQSTALYLSNMRCLTIHGPNQNQPLVDKVTMAIRGGGGW